MRTNKIGHIARTPNVSVIIRPYTYSYIMFNRIWADKFIRRDDTSNINRFVETIKQYLEENKRIY